jgi:rubredoxin
LNCWVMGRAFASRQNEASSLCRLLRARAPSQLEPRVRGDNFPDMRSSDIICPQCKAGYRRIEVTSGRRTKGEYRCRLCDYVLEVFDGSTEIAIRLTVRPEKIFE